MPRLRDARLLETVTLIQKTATTDATSAAAIAALVMSSIPQERPAEGSPPENVDIASASTNRGLNAPTKTATQIATPHQPRSNRDNRGAANVANTRDDKTRAMPTATRT